MGTARVDDHRLDDIAAAIFAIRGHLARAPLTDGLVADAVRMRLVEISEAVSAIGEVVRSAEPMIPWQKLAEMRDHLADRDLTRRPQALQRAVDNQLQPLEAAVARLRDLTRD